MVENKMYFVDGEFVIERDGKKITFNPMSGELRSEDTEAEEDEREVCPHQYCENWADACEKH